MESKVLKLVHKGKKRHFANLQEKTEGGGWIDLSGGIKGDAGVVLVALVRERDSLVVWGCCVGCVLVARSLALASLQLRAAL